MIAVHKFACCVATLLLLLFSVTSAVLFGLRSKDHSLSRWQSESFQFAWNGHHIEGTIWLPSVANQSVVALVHGDGPQDRTSDGGYIPLINSLLDEGIAVASWDKLGIGESEGSWLDQSLSDRADETRSALGKLRERFDGLEVGAIGFSQAGWVLPRLTTNDLQYIVLVGPAVNWEAQGEYFTRKRMEIEGASPPEIEDAVARNKEEDDIIFNAPTFPNVTDLTEQRWAFIKRNRHEDSRVYLQNLTVPLLAAWGEDDLNVDAIEDSKIYEELLCCGGTVVLIPGATHGLLKSSHYNYQLSDQWPWRSYIRFLLDRRSAYVDGALELMTDWIQDQAKP